MEPTRSSVPRQAPLKDAEAATPPGEAPKKEEPPTPGTLQLRPGASVMQQAPDLRAGFAAQGMASTFKSFTTATIASGFLPPNMRWIATPFGGALHAYQRQQQAGITFDPALTHAQGRMVLAAALSPFPLTFGIQGLLTHRASVPGSMAAKIPEALQSRWQAFCKTLPQGVGSALARYPLNFVLARAAAHMGAAGSGSFLAQALIKQAEGNELVERDMDSKAHGPHVDPLAMFGGAALFTAPALLGKPSVAPHLARLGPVGGPMVSGAALVATALITNEFLYFLKATQDGKYVTKDADGR